MEEKFMQLDLFEHTQIAPDQLFIQFLELKTSHDKLRKGIFQRYQDLRNVVSLLEAKLEELTLNK